jgi:peptide/nickel transport system permease protein
MTIVEGAVQAIGATPDEDEPGPKVRRRIARLLALAWLALVAVLALIIPLLPAPKPGVSVGKIAASPFGHYLLGTDQLGRDIFSRVCWGARISIEVAGLSTVIAFVVGVGLGLLAGYFRGFLETVIGGIADLSLAFPGLVLLLVLTSIRGASAHILIIALAILLTPTFVRLGRANTLAFMQREFVLAARSLGARHRRIMLREVLPNVLPSVSVYALTAAASVFVVEGSLSFLGLGIPPPTPSWGSMIAGGQQELLQHHPHMVLVPSVVLFLTVLSLNVLGNSRQDAGDRSRPVGSL